MPDYVLRHQDNVLRWSGPCVEELDDDGQRLSPRCLEDSLLGEALSRNLTREEKRVLNFVAEYGKINVTQCRRLIPILAKWHSAKRLLMKLVDEGLLKQIHRAVIRDNKPQFVPPEAFRPERKQ